MFFFLVGITHYTQRGHIARATMEAACFQTKAILDAMAMDSGHELSKLAVDGGMSNADICMQVRSSLSPLFLSKDQSLTSTQSQADIIQIPVERPSMHETTALGTAIAAGFAIGVWTEFEELRHMNRANRTMFTPAVTRERSERMYKKWSKAVEMSRGWVDANEMA